jgi:hypothetical protein
VCTWRKRRKVDRCDTGYSWIWINDETRQRYLERNHKEIGTGLSPSSLYGENIQEFHLPQPIGRVRGNEGREKRRFPSAHIEMSMGKDAGMKSTMYERSKFQFSLWISEDGTRGMDGWMGEQGERVSRLPGTMVSWMAPARMNHDSFHC